MLRKLHSGLLLVSLVASAAEMAAGQNTPAQDTTTVADAIRHIRNDEPGPAPENRLEYVNIIAQAAAVEAIPVLEDYYRRATDPVVKQGVASALVHLGDKSTIYPDYLAADAIQRVRNNELGVGPEDAMSYINWIAYSKDPEGIPVLEQYFSRTNDRDLKAGVASALVRMGDKGDTYWEYLVTLAKAVENDAPGPFNWAADKPNDPISPEFRLWAETQNIPVEEALGLMFKLAQGLAPLAKTGDPRGIPLLRRALRSPNVLISGLAAAGLAQANDVASVPLIVDACKKMRPEVAHFLAESLLYFDDPLAQSTYHLYFPNTNVAEDKAFRQDIFADIPPLSR